MASELKLSDAGTLRLLQAIACTHPRKVKYYSEAEANEAVKDYKKTVKEHKSRLRKMNVYRCGGHWHIGHNKRQG